MGDRRYVRSSTTAAPRRNHVPTTDHTVEGYIRAEEEARAKREAAIVRAIEELGG